LHWLAVTLLPVSSGNPPDVRMHTYARGPPLSPLPTHTCTYHGTRAAYFPPCMPAAAQGRTQPVG